MYAVILFIAAVLILSNSALLLLLQLQPPAEDLMGNKVISFIVLSFIKTLCLQNINFSETKRDFIVQKLSKTVRNCRDVSLC